MLVYITDYRSMFLRRRAECHISANVAVYTKVKFTSSRDYRDFTEGMDFSDAEDCRLVTYVAVFIQLEMCRRFGTSCCFYAQDSSEMKSNFFETSAGFCQRPRLYTTADGNRDGCTSV